MAEATAPAPASAAASSGGSWSSPFIRIAWRNLWRIRRRTWLSAGGIATAILLVTAFVSIQLGSYDQMIDIATRLLSGHAQVQHEDYQGDPKIDHVVTDVDAIMEAIEAIDGIAGVTPRAEAFALISAGERSFGGLVIGVDPLREPRHSSLSGRLVQGEYLPTETSAYLGKLLAANLGLQLGDEVVVLGSTKDGGVAASVFSLDGLFETGQSELDRTIMQVPFTAMQEGFELGGGVHRLVISLEDVSELPILGPEIDRALPEGLRLVTWKELMPEVDQSIQMDWVSGQVIYALLMMLVVLSLVNAFIMVVFERTREFGMLLSIGMRPNAILAMLVAEAVFMWVLGTLLGLVLTTAILWPLSVAGLAIPGMEELAERFMMPDRIYPSLDFGSLVLPSAVMLIGTVLAVLIPALRIKAMKPVEALRDDE